MIPARDSSAVYWYSGQRTGIRDMSFQIPENKGTKSFKATYLCFYDFLELVLFFYYYYFIQSGNN